MTIDDYTFHDKKTTFCKNTLDAMPDALLILCARKLQVHFHGLKQDKPNVEMLRQRVLAKFQLNSTHHGPIS